MKSLVAYVRGLLGWGEDTPDLRLRSSFKRDREDDISSDDEPPTLKRLRQLNKNNFADILSSNDDKWDRINMQKKNVRYVPIHIEAGHPSTSTPKDFSSKPASRVRTIPIKLLDGSSKPSTPHRKPRLHTPVRPIIQAVIDDEDDDDEVTLVETQPKISNRQSAVKSIYQIDLNDENEDDVVFVEKVQPSNVKYYIKNSDKDFDDTTELYRISQKSNDRNVYLSPKTYSRLKNTGGITKAYKKQPTQVPRWMQTQKQLSNLPSLKNKYLNQNGNVRSTLSQVFNLDEKRNYQELIRRVSENTKPISLKKNVEIINLAEDAASFRMTQKSQKRSLDEIKLVERGFNTNRENEISKEYDPITVASLNSSDSEVEVVPSETSTSSVRIDPINSLRDSFRDKAVISSDWLAKLDLKYNKKRIDTQSKLKDARRESDIIAKVNSEQKLAHLEQKLKHELSIPECLIVEPQPTVELPELTPEQESLVSRALGPGPPNQLFIEKFNLRIHRRDLQTLANLNWLNDEVINFYMNLLMQRSEERKDLPKVYATNTFFYPKLMQSGQAGLRRWTRKIDIFAHDLMIVPVHLGVHWCVSIIDFREKKINYLDSMGGRNVKCLDALLQYLKDEHQDKKGEPHDDAGWQKECLKDIPQQMNGSDCGMFSCTFAEFSCRNAPYTFSQNHMPYLRRKAALEILQGKLLL